MSRFHLQLVTDTSLVDDLPKAVSAAAAAGVDSVQLREKHLPARALLELAQALSDPCRRFRTGLFINDRVDVTVASGACGTHLGGNSLPVTVARALLGQGRLVGVSVHSLAEAQAAAAAGADYLIFGSIFPTRSHPGQPPAGLSALRQVVESVSLPVLAIGGITAENLASVLATGCAGVAVISAILAAPAPDTATATLRAALDRSSHRPRIPFPDCPWPVPVGSLIQIS